MAKIVLLINIHLVLHLKDCIKNYSSCYGDLRFGFERFNGLLGNYHANNCSIEIQVMRKFPASSYIQAHSLIDAKPEEFDFESAQTIYKIQQSEVLNGQSHEFEWEKVSISHSNILSIDQTRLIKESLQGLYNNVFVENVSMSAKVVKRIGIICHISPLYCTMALKAHTIVFARRQQCSLIFFER